MLRYVDPLIAINHPGDCLCGPHLPHSIVRLQPDTLDAGWATHGYQSFKPITHFSHTHVSGTGGGGRYGNIGVMPFIGLPRLVVEAAEPAGESAAPGYYRVELLPAGITVELTSSPRVGVHRYTFPAGAQAHLLIDLGAVVQIPRHKPGEETGASIGGYVEFISDSELVGRADLRGGWGHWFPYAIYFYARFDQPASLRQVANQDGILLRTVADGPHCKAVAGFGAARTVGLHVGISHVSVANARAAVERETAGRSFEEVRASAEAVWQQALSRISVDGGTEEQKLLFYTLFSRLLAMPTDLGIDDEYPAWKSGVRHFTDFYCLWDSVRNANSLITLFDPALEADMLNCLLDIGDHLGWIPDAWIAGHSAMIQGGSSADILLCEAALKNLPGIDYAKALRQMRKNTEVESPDPRLYGRYLPEYRDLGYLTTQTNQSVSRHLEYSYQDWCIGRLADQLGETDTARACYRGAGKLWNLWRDDLRCFAPRHPTGDWVQPFDPDNAREDSWNDPYFYEGTSRQWSFSAHHDFAGLVARHGGPAAFIRHLDAFFAAGSYYSKETMLHIPYLYHYAGRPDLSADRVRACLASSFAPTRDGLADNEDMGCQSAFYMASTMGLYPIMGQDIYLLIAPAFSHVAIQLGAGGATLEIDAPDATAENRYIVSATLNGRPLDRAWIRHHEITHGAVLHYALSDTPASWGTATPPPSPMAEIAIG